MSETMLSADAEKALAGMDAARRAGWAKFFEEKRAAVSLAELLCSWVANERVYGDKESMLLEHVIAETGFIAATQPAVEAAIEAALESNPEIAKRSSGPIRESIAYMKSALLVTRYPEEA